VYNIGHPYVISVSDLARMMCNHLGIDYKSHVNEIDQPPQMTLMKNPYVEKQLRFTKITPLVDIEDGVNRVLRKTKERLGVG
jgi:nucleoside-diphosphate-sugar epimerase